MLKKEISIQICKLGNAMNANEVYTWMLMRKYPAGYADPDASYTGYADTDADLCIRIMSLCCTIYGSVVLKETYHIVD